MTLTDSRTRRGPREHARQRHRHDRPDRRCAGTARHFGWDAPAPRHEILTYLRSGRVLHRDTVGDAEEISAARLMLMNAGAEFQHEELVQPDGEVLRGLQIFLRPSEGGLAPKVQFHDFGDPVSHGAWRRVIGPEETAPLVVRSRSRIDDGRFSPGPVELTVDPAADYGVRLRGLCDFSIGYFESGGSGGSRPGAHMAAMNSGAKITL